jgi:hypothetical protein
VQRIAAPFAALPGRTVLAFVATSCADRLIELRRCRGAHAVCVFCCMLQVGAVFGSVQVVLCMMYPSKLPER